ncbi:hypothetical protein [Paenibacillus sp. GSMTC-2017]|uniref:hypothetical protein n=1 Tax=Paenibacillus sp. GSMTC-2017 TaxID=2794350 RepID=UPI0018D681D7|nr:hypothetical protein [Paenibacillus sp. GSMTC-2017]
MIKSKCNTVLYRKITSSGRRDRYSARQLVKEAHTSPVSQPDSALAAIGLQDIYMKLPYPATERNGQATTEYRLVPIAAVVATRLKEDEESNDLVKNNGSIFHIPEK